MASSRLKNIHKLAAYKAAENDESREMDERVFFRERRQQTEGEPLDRPFEVYETLGLK